MPWFRSKKNAKMTNFTSAYGGSEIKKKHRAEKNVLF